MLKEELIRHAEVLKEFIEEEKYAYAQVVHKDINEVFGYLGLELLLEEAVAEKEVPRVEAKAMVDDIFGLPGEETREENPSEDLEGLS
tara:strand:- start:1188 stop:1451 length:264 start_codon:yes stop_codon:yes gene_type:complete